MIMTNTAERARREQEEHFNAHPSMANEEVRRITVELYDSIDALNVDQKSLLGRECLGRLHSLMFQVAEASPAASGAAQVGTALVGVGGYAIETAREQAGFTATGDAKVDRIMQLVRDLLAESAKAMMPKEQAAKMDGVKDRVLDRVQRGEGFEEAMDDELRKVGITPPAAQTSDSRKEAETGFYL